MSSTGRTPGFHPGQRGFESRRCHHLEFESCVWYNTHMTYKDTEARRLYAQRYYQEHKPEFRTYIRDRRYRIKEWVDSLKNNCERCGYNACKRALEFHHRDSSEKEHSISSMVRERKSHELILLEIKKCQLLCANCHAEKHSPKIKERVTMKPERPQEPPPNRV